MHKQKIFPLLIIGCLLLSFFITTQTAAAAGNNGSVIFGLFINDAPAVNKAVALYNAATGAPVQAKVTDTSGRCSFINLYFPASYYVKYTYEGTTYQSSTVSLTSVATGYTSITISGTAPTPAPSPKTVVFAQTTGGIIQARVGPLTVYPAGSYSINSGVSLYITTVAEEGYIFDYYSFDSSVYGTGNVYNNPLTTTVYSDFTLTAHFKALTTNEDVHFLFPSQTGSLFFTYGGNKISISSEQTKQIDTGSTVLIGPVDMVGYVYNGLNVTFVNGTSLMFYNNNDNPLELLIDQEIWVSPLYTLDYGSEDIFTFYCNSASGGVVNFLYDSGGDGISVKSYPAGAYAVYRNSLITITATPDAGYSFDYWTYNTGFSSEIVDNPFIFTIYGNSSITPHFSVSGAGDWGFNFGDFATDFTTIIEMVVVAFLLFGGVMILLKAPSAWVIGVILVIVGFFGNLLLQTNIYGLVVFGLEMILFTVFLYSGSNAVRRSK